MGNTLQPNPSDATADLVQPDWNSAAGQGVAPVGDDAVDLDETYVTQRATAKERFEAREAARSTDGMTNDWNNSGGGGGLLGV